MNPKKPHDTLTWKKDDEYLTIDRTLHETTRINKTTGTEYTITQVSEIPPITHTRKRKQK